MAIVRAIASGNWSNTAIWNTGALPTSADDVYSNTFSVTIDINVNVLSIRNSSTTGVTAGGNFSVNASGITITATIAPQQGNLLFVNATGTTAINGTIIGANNAGAGGVIFQSSGTLNTTGTITGNGGGAGAPAVQVTASGTLNHTGAVTPSNVSIGIVNSSGGVVNITGDVYAGSNTNINGVNNTSIGIVNITGNCYGSSSASFGVSNSGTGTVTIVGGCYGSTNISGAAATNSSSGTLTVNGTMQAGGGGPGIGFGSASQITIITGDIIADASGVVGIAAVRWFPSDSGLSTLRIQLRGPNLVSGSRPIRNFYSTWNSSIGNYPVPANVRSGILYGDQNFYLGTLSVPPAGSVALGVPVDNTAGTATLTAANVRAAVGLASANLDTQLSGITSGISGLPSASAIASAVWAAATRTLTTAIDNSSTIAAAVWSYATGRTITGGTVDTLVNSPSVPSAATIASQVRTELSTELARIDVATSTRLAPSGTLARVTLTDTATTLTNAPTVPSAAQIATQVRTELTPELARVANCATTQEVDDIVEGALS